MGWEKGRIGVFEDLLRRHLKQAHHLCAHLERISSVFFVNWKSFYLFFTESRSTENCLRLNLHQLVSIFVNSLVLLAFADVNFLVDGNWADLVWLAMKQWISVVDQRLPVFTVSWRHVGHRDAAVEEAQAVEKELIRLKESLNCFELTQLFCLVSTICWWTRWESPGTEDAVESLNRQRSNAWQQTRCQLDATPSPLHDS